MERIEMRVKCDDRKKVCSACGVPKLLSEFYDDDRYLYGVKGVCKECYNRRAKARKPTGKKNKRGDEHKRECSTCNETKPLEEFEPDYHCFLGYGYRCKECNAKRQRERRKIKENRETDKKWRESAQGMQSLKNGQNKYSTNYPERRMAKDAVRHAIVTGKLPHPNTLKCIFEDISEGLPCNGQMQYHHLNYSKQFHLVVVPLCIRHHKLLHRLLKERRRPTIVSLRLSGLPPLLINSLRDLVS